MRGREFLPRHGLEVQDVERLVQRCNDGIGLLK